MATDLLLVYFIEKTAWTLTHVVIIPATFKREQLCVLFSNPVSLSIFEMAGIDAVISDFQSSITVILILLKTALEVYRGLAINFQLAWTISKHIVFEVTFIFKF